MKLSGRCYCGDIRYTFDGEVQGALQCHCRECQYITGGNANVVMALPESIPVPWRRPAFAEKRVCVMKLLFLITEVDSSEFCFS